MGTDGRTREIAGSVRRIVDRFEAEDASYTLRVILFVTNWLRLGYHLVGLLLYGAGVGSLFALGLLRNFDPSVRAFLDRSFVGQSAAAWFIALAGASSVVSLAYLLLAGFVKLIRAGGETSGPPRLPTLMLIACALCMMAAFRTPLRDMILYFLSPDGVWGLLAYMLAFAATLFIVVAFSVGSSLQVAGRSNNASARSRNVESIISDLIRHIDFSTSLKAFIVMVGVTAYQFGQRRYEFFLDQSAVCLIVADTPIQAAVIYATSDYLVVRLDEGKEFSVVSIRDQNYSVNALC